MAVKQAEKRLTVEDYLALPDEYPRYELLEGELVEMVSPTVRHQQILLRLARLLQDYCRANRAGQVLVAPLDVILAKHIVVQPDLIFVSQARWKELVKDRIYGAPDLLIEILSPSTSQRDYRAKRKLYARHGVPEYWIVDPEDVTIEVQRRQETFFSTVGLYEAGQTLSSPTFPDLKLDINQVFADADFEP